MPVEDFLRTYQTSMANKQIVNPLSSSPVAIKNPKLEIKTPKREIHTTPSYGSTLPDWLDARKTGAVDRYIQNKNDQTTRVAQDYTKKAAGQVPTNEFGIVQDKLTDFSGAFNKQLETTTGIGRAHLATEESKAEWQRLQELQELNAGYSINWTPGASKSNPGSKAVSYAMTAYQNKVPYAWGGNSLTRGVDCSGLVQQVYKKLGINLPRTTYEQAKSGKQVSVNNLLPGDLVFYNTGRGDPNGIGSLSHVGIYIGNGQIIDARNSRSGIKIGSMNVMGGPALAVRPW